MAWAVDRTSIGSPASASGAATTVALTTNVTVASGAWIYLAISWFTNSTPLASVAGGGLTWSIASQVQNGSQGVALARAYAPSGLASATAITATWGGSVSFRGICGSSFTGGSSSHTPQDPSTATGSSNTHTNTVTTSTANALIVEAAILNTTGVHTPTSPAVELQDFSTTGGERLVLQYRTTTTPGDYVIAGGWGASNSWSVAAAGFEEATGGGGTAHTQNIDDSIAGTDATAKATAATRTDSIAGTDARSTAWAATRTIADTAGGTDAQAKAATHPIADPAAATDATARAWDATRLLGDTGTLTDSVNTGGSTAHTHTVDDTIAGTDTAAKHATHPVSDTGSLTDTLNRAWAALITQADTGQLSDSLSSPQFAQPPVTHPSLGGVYDETATGGTYDETPTGGIVTAPTRSGTVPAFKRGGRTLTPLRSGTPSEPKRGGTHDETATGGEVL